MFGAVQASHKKLFLPCQPCSLNRHGVREGMRGNAEGIRAVGKAANHVIMLPPLFVPILLPGFGGGCIGKHWLKRERELEGGGYRSYESI